MSPGARLWGLSFAIVIGILCLVHDSEGVRSRLGRGPPSPSSRAFELIDDRFDVLLDETAEATDQMDPMFAAAAASNTVALQEKKQLERKLALKKKLLEKEAKATKALADATAAKAKNAELNKQLAAQKKALRAAQKLANIQKTKGAAYEKQKKSAKKKYNSLKARKRRQMQRMRAKIQARKEKIRKQEKRHKKKKRQVVGGSEWGSSKPNAPEWEKIDDTAWADKPPAQLAPATGEGAPNADYGEDFGVPDPDAQIPAKNHDGAPEDALRSIDNTALAARDIIDERKAARSHNAHAADDPLENNDKRLLAQHKKTIEELRKVVLSQSKLIKHFKSPEFAKSIETVVKKKLLKQHHAVLAAKKNGTTVAPTPAPTLKATLRATPKPTNTTVKNTTTTKKKVFLEEVAEVQEPQAPSSAKMIPPAKKKKSVDTTPREEDDTIIGDVVAMQASEASLLPIGIVTDGYTTYPVGIHKLGPELLTKIGQRVAVKGQPIETDLGDRALEVNGFKVQSESPLWRQVSWTKLKEKLDHIDKRTPFKLPPPPGHSFPIPRDFTFGDEFVHPELKATPQPTHKPTNSTSSNSSKTVAK